MIKINYFTKKIINYPSSFFTSPPKPHGFVLIQIQGSRLPDLKLLDHAIINNLGCPYYQNGVWQTSDGSYYDPDKLQFVISTRGDRVQNPNYVNPVTPIDPNNNSGSNSNNGSNSNARGFGGSNLSKAFKVFILLLIFRILAVIFIYFYFGFVFPSSDGLTNGILSFSSSGLINTKLF